MKKFISGLIIGLVLATATSVTAAGGILAQFADFNLVVNGQAKVLQTKPLVYNGTSYLPVREIANLVGYDVTYKADSRTIELNTATAHTESSKTSTIQTPAQDIKDSSNPLVIQQNGNWYAKGRWIIEAVEAKNPGLVSSLGQKGEFEMTNGKIIQLQVVTINGSIYNSLTEILDAGLLTESDLKWTL